MKRTVCDRALPAARGLCLRCLGLVGDASVVPVLVSALCDAGDFSSAAEDALVRLPSKEVVPALLDALRNRPADRVPVIRALVKLKCYGAIERAATIRTLDTVNWIARYLDDPELAQTACRAIVELAHHRFLRHPNMDQFGPILEKVGRISKDPTVIERAKRYQLARVYKLFLIVVVTRYLQWSCAQSFITLKSRFGTYSVQIGP